MAKVGETILEQLGGNKFLAMTGAKRLVLLERGLQFDIPVSQGVDRVQIVLAGADTYTVAFYKWKARELALKAVGPFVNGVYAAELQSIFAARTGLRTSL